MVEWLRPRRPPNRDPPDAKIRAPIDLEASVNWRQTENEQYGIDQTDFRCLLPFELSKEWLCRLSPTAVLFFI